MQSPDHGPDEDALYDRIRTAKNAAFRLAAKMAPRFANQFSIFKDVLNMDDMSGWPLLRQAKEWEGKLVLLTDMNADAVHLAELPAGGSPGAEYPPIPPGGPAVSTVQHALLARSAPALPALPAESAVVRGNRGGVSCKRRDRGRDSAPYEEESSRQEPWGDAKRRRRFAAHDDDLWARRQANAARQAAGYTRMRHVKFAKLIADCGAAIQERLLSGEIPPPPRTHSRLIKSYKTENPADPADFWKTVVAASVVAEETGLLPLNDSQCHSLEKLL